VGVFVASICYGLSKEINDVSTFGYILSHASPDEYGKILARNNITFGIGSLIGLVLSGIVLSINAGFAVIFLAIIIISFLSFTAKFFDTSLESVSIEDVKEFTISVKKLNKENVKEFLVEKIQIAELEKVVSQAKYILMKPNKVEGNAKVPWKDVQVQSMREFKIIWEILSHKPLHMSLIWTMTLVLTFGFWDTFASSFLLDFLDQIQPGWSYILLAVIGVPGIVLQEKAGNIGEKIGIKTIGLIGLGLSGGSLILMGVLAMIPDINPLLILGAALINSLGYACGMSTGQNQFLDQYNRIYAKHENLSEINANASSGPMKVVQNMANVIGLVFGGILVGLGFPMFFFIFGGIVLGLLAWTMTERDNINL
jgi:Major Facilitator Superfamily